MFVENGNNLAVTRSQVVFPVFVEAGFETNIVIH